MPFYFDLSRTLNMQIDCIFIIKESRARFDLNLLENDAHKKAGTKKKTLELYWKNISHN